MSDDSEPFDEIGSEDYSSESKSLGLTSTPTPDSANQLQEKMARHPSTIIRGAPERGVQSTNVALPPTPNTTLELKGHQDSNSDGTIPSQTPEIQEKVLRDNTTNSAKQSPSCEGLQMKGLLTILDELHILMKLPNPGAVLQVLEKHGRISSENASFWDKLVASTKPPTQGLLARWPHSSTHTLFLYEIDDAQLQFDKEKHDGSFVPKLNCDGRPCVEMGQEPLLMLGEEHHAGTYDALATFCHLTTRLNNLLSTKNPDDEKQYKTLRAYAIELGSFAEHKWHSEMQKKYGTSIAADVNTRRYHSVCYLIYLVGQTVLVNATNLRRGYSLRGRLDWVITTFDLELVKFQIRQNFMPQPEYKLSKLGTEFHIVIEGERKPLEKLFPESFPRDGENIDSTAGSARAPSPSISDVGPLCHESDPWDRGL